MISWKRHSYDIHSRCPPLAASAPIHTDTPRAEQTHVYDQLDNWSRGGRHAERQQKSRNHSFEWRSQRKGRHTTTKPTDKIFFLYLISKVKTSRKNYFINIRTTHVDFPNVDRINKKKKTQELKC